jgi:glycosyltransferase involved in cell wall biosynthesis
MLTIFHYIPSIDRTSGGVGVYMQLLATGLGRKVNLHVVTHRSQNELEIPNCTVHYISSRWLPPLGTRREYETLLSQVHPDVVHCNCCWTPLSALTAQWAKGKGYPVVYSPHGMLEPWILSRHYWTKKVPALFLYQRRALQESDCIHATADSERKNLLKLGYNDHVAVIPNCVDVTHIRMKQSWERRKEILFLSRIHEKKGINFLIEAFAQLRTEFQGYTIRIAGEGDAAYVTSLKSLAQSLGVANQVIFEGGVYGDRKWQLFRQADLFVLPTHSENFGIAVAEALSCGTPVLTTQGTPWKELITHHCGWWTEIGTAPTVAALSQFLTLSVDELEGYGRRGRQLIADEYSTEAIADAFVSLYQQISWETAF